MARSLVDRWLTALVDRHTRALSRAEFLKAVRALSARYVERRAELGRRSPLDSAGKRAAFAAYYAPLHLLMVQHVTRALGAATPSVQRILDLGCGTGTSSAGWALACDRAPTLTGIDRSAWALGEAAWNWRALGLAGRTRQGDLVAAASARSSASGGRFPSAILVAWSANELDDDARAVLLQALLGHAASGRAVLVIEPLARSAAPWWSEWADTCERVGGRADEWQEDVPVPAALADISEGAGFRRPPLRARSLWWPAGQPRRNRVLPSLMDRAPSTPADRDLVDGLRAGDPQVFEALVRGQGPRLLSVTRRILKDEEEARDAVQDAFVSAFRARQQFNAKSQISTWLHRIAVNAALTRLRTRRRRPEDSLDDLLPRFMPNGHHVEHFTAWTEPADVVVSRKETAAQVREAIDSLPETFRTVLMLRDIEGLSSEEAASLLNITPNAVKLRLHRARMALRTLLAPRFQGASA
jgi:RNA polymerase sigma-70 factor (ECF subfamily)